MRFDIKKNLQAEKDPDRGPGSPYLDSGLSERVQAAFLRRSLVNASSGIPDPPCNSRAGIPANPLSTSARPCVACHRRRDLRPARFGTKAPHFTSTLRVITRTPTVSCED
ncbi:hypothetical protein GCM10020221_01500 [Streptomyces thioluteus]|uniref:Uncharacterized protein n=1 Tax=Streptomyces thioluteus TaxID=66431 RepID=A0ABN3WC74_STRTU